MFGLSIQVQSRVHQGDGPTNSVPAVFLSNLVHGALQVGKALAPLLVWEQGELDGAGGGEAAGPDGQASYRVAWAILLEEVKSGVKNVCGVLGGVGQLGLPLIPEKAGVPDTNLDGGAHGVLLPEACGYRIAEGVEGDLHVLIGHKVPGGRGRVAHSLDEGEGGVCGNSGVVLAVGELPEHNPDFSK